ncbi:MAG: nitroreductase family protein [Deltaproteobacteria bacterium]|jgi:nitroreductase/NAD-dependent dihydropyrimidine dehydrogenase PreA subunit
MSLFTVDLNKCAKDGVCAAECPMSIITMEHGIPEPVEGAARMCINCGHCMAVCPTGAFVLSTMDPAACTEVEPDRLPSADALGHLVRSRRSTRVYKKKPVEREKLARLLDTARYAPTGKNTQLISWLVVNGKEVLEGLSGGTINWMRDLIAKKDPLATAYGMKRVVAAWEQGFSPVLRSAPCLIVTHAPENYRGGVVDSTIALTTFELAAATEGLGCCWAGFFFIAASQWPPLKEVLGLPAGEAITGAMMVGYPKHRYQRIPLRNEARVTWR